MRHPTPYLPTLILSLLFVPQSLAQEGSFGYSVAPENCLMFSSWTGLQPAADGSTNQAELMMSEPEIVEFGEQITEQITVLATLAMRDQPALKQQAVKAMMPQVMGMLFARPGCLLVESVDVDIQEETVKVEAGLAFEFGEGAEQFLNSLITMSEGEGLPLRKEKLEERDAYAVMLPKSPFKSVVYLSAVDGKLLVGVGRASMTKLVQAALGRYESGKPKWLAELEKQLPVPRRTSVGFVNLEAIYGQAMETAGPAAQAIQTMVQALGLHRLKSITNSSGYDEMALVDHARLSWNGPGSGLLTMVGTEPLNLKSLQNVPADALYVTSISINLNNVIKKAIEFMREFSPRDVEGFGREMGQMADEIGINPQTDILAHLGSTWTLFNGAGDGLGVGTLLTVDLKDQVALERVNQDLISTFQQLDVRGGPQILARELADATVYTLTVPDFPMPVQPSWSLHDGHLWVSLYPQTLRPYIDLARSDEKLDLSELAVEEGIVGFAYQDVKRLYEMIYAYGAMFGGMAGVFADEAGLGPDTEVLGQTLSQVTLPSYRSVYRHILPSQSVLRSDESGWQLTSYQTVPSVNIVVAGPIGVALLLPAVQAARDSSRRATSMNNLKLIGLAVHNHGAAYRSLLPAAYTKAEDGTPLLSWRVKLLPFLGYTNLYERFNLDEPWDSDHNIALLEEMPEAYRSPVSMADPGMTVYLGNGGEHGMLSNNPEDEGGIRFGQVTDGLSNTIMVIEASDQLAEPWTKPTEFEFDPDTSWQLFGPYPDGTNAVLGDGSVHFLSEYLDIDTWKALFSRDDGEVVNAWD